VADSIKERIRKAGPTTRTVRVWLGADLDLIDEYEAAEQAVEQAKQPADSLAGSGSIDEATQRLERVRARLDECAVDFKLRGLDDLHYCRLLEQHPPRRAEDGTLDERDRTGWHKETFPPALVRACVVEPELDDEDWAALLGDEGRYGLLTSVQLDGLAAEAFALTRHPVDVPFSRAASPQIRNSGRA